MPLINIVPPDKAQGKVKENYAVFDQFGMVPTPFQMFSATPDLQALRLPVMKYFMGHPRLSPGLLAFIRMMVSEETGYHYCVSLNRNILQKLGIADDDQLAKVLADPSQAPLSEAEKALLAFVIKGVTTPDAVGEADVKALRELGWSDGDMVDAMSMGVDMVAAGIMFKAFKMGEGEAC